MAENNPTASAKLQVAEPRLFGPAAMLKVNAWGLVLLIPVVLAVLGMSLCHQAWLMLALPVAAVATSAFVLPLGVGNAYIARLVQGGLADRLKDGTEASATAPKGPTANSGEHAATPRRFVVQVALCPRARSGLSGLMEDADDFGLLMFHASSLEFQGDSIRCEIPSSSVTRVDMENVGWRGLFVYGARIRVTVQGLSGVEAVEFAERSSWILSQSRRVTREIRACFQTAIGR